MVNPPIAPSTFWGRGAQNRAGNARGWSIRWHRNYHNEHRVRHPEGVHTPVGIGHNRCHSRHRPTGNGGTARPIFGRTAPAMIRSRLGLWASLIAVAAIAVGNSIYSVGTVDLKVFLA